jgi:hypothetical protein
MKLEFTRFGKGLQQLFPTIWGGGVVTSWLESWFKCKADIFFRYQKVASRAAIGLDVNDYKFSALPPHFNEKSESVLTVEECNTILYGYSDFFPQLFRVAVPYLLASLYDHKQWLK